LEEDMDDVQTLLNGLRDDKRNRVSEDDDQHQLKEAKLAKICKAIAKIANRYYLGE
jgi:hypothetical protein